VIAQTRNGKQVLNTGEGGEAKAVTVVDGDHVAVLGDNRKLLLFPLKDLPEMPRGRGVILQRYKDGGLADVRCFDLKAGLTWVDAAGRQQSLGDPQPWLDERARAGRLVPRGFPKANRFTPS
jgi:topoisomerase-4 subunit A